MINVASHLGEHLIFIHLFFLLFTMHSSHLRSVLTLHTAKGGVTELAIMPRSEEFQSLCSET